MHLSVYVIVSRGTTDIVAEVTRLLAGNVAFIDEEVMGHVPAVILTPDGYWYEGPLDLDPPWQLEDELDPWEMDQRQAWRLLAGQLLGEHRGELVVQVDCHF